MLSRENNIIPLNLKSPYLKEPVKVNLVVGAYLNNKSLSISLFATEHCEPYADLTVNVDDDIELAPYQAAVKNYSENEGMDKFVEENGLGEHTGKMIRSGYVMLPIYQFDREKLLAFSLNGVQEYETQLSLN
jgi:hypothetical protein